MKWMFQKCLVAILLVPASFLVHGSLRAWLRALRGGKRAFFSAVVKNGPERVQRSGSPLFNLVVYYPLKAGLELMHGGVRSLLRKAWRTISGMGAEAESAPPRAGNSHLDASPPFISLERIREMIRNPAITIVSFDVFDTLLVRPALRPDDIFFLLAKKLDALHGVDFAAMRRDAEERLGGENPTIREIYEGMARRHALDPDLAQTLMEEELRCEETLLSPRRDVKLLHDEAARLGKRIIAVSDMYLPGDILDGILRGKGCPVSAVYVSCDHAARKSDGALYDVVIASEKAHPSEILHIGDNYHSDYVEAIGKKMTAVWYPSVFERCFPHRRLYEALFGEATRGDPLWSVYLGFALNKLYSDPAEAPTNIANVRNLRHFALLTLAPLVTAFCLFLVTDKGIQRTRKKLYFASRDGWLPHRIYSRIRERLGGAEGVYFVAGRRAYYPCLYDSFFDFAASLPDAAESATYTLGAFLKAYFSDTDLLSHMEKKLSDEEKALPFFLDKIRCLDILRRFDREIEGCMREKRARIKAYYESVFDPAEKRHLVIDLGYSGSLGKAVAVSTGVITDKIYFWEEEKNRQRDRNFGSTTRLFMENETYKPYNLLLEELFSPCEGGVVGFDDNGQPIIEEIFVSDAHERDLGAVHDACIEYAGEFCALLGKYAPYAVLRAPGAAIHLCRALLREAPFCNLRLFKNIAFPDPVHRSRLESLEKKIEAHMAPSTVFFGTGFDNPDNVFSRPPHLCASLTIGIHLHLHHVFMAHEIMRYLQDFPAPFDLYVTITDEAFTRTVGNLFSRNFLPGVRTLRVLPMLNRGRDVAPWILGMRPFQAAYDLFCHIHSKGSAHIGFGDEWRKYLFDNLIKSDTVREILNCFEEYHDIGCIFPSMHAKLRHVMTNVGQPLYGSEQEYGLICDLLRRMGMREELPRSELFFSAGTMLWYRPPALRQLFTCDLSLEEFTEEPIGTGGTLAHAIERLPAVVSERNGYAVHSLTRYAPG